MTEEMGVFRKALDSQVKARETDKQHHKALLRATVSIALILGFVAGFAASHFTAQPVVVVACGPSVQA